MFKSKQSIGIDIRDQQITAAIVDRKKGKPRLSGVFISHTEEKWLAGRKIVDSKHFSGAIRKLMKLWIPGRQTHLAVPTEHVILRKISSLPDVPRRELAKILDFEIGESIHLPFEKSQYDFIVLPKQEKKPNDEVDEFENQLEKLEEPKNEVMLIATDHEFITDLTKSVLDAWLTPVSAEIRALSLQRLVHFLQPDWLQGTEVILDIGKYSCDVHIFHRGIVVFTRNIALEGRLQNVEQDVPSSDEGFINDLLQELERAQNFYRYTLNQRDQEIQQLIITGEYAQSFLSKLKNRLDFPIQELDFRSLLTREVRYQKKYHSCSVAIGLALRGM